MEEANDSGPTPHTFGRRAMLLGLSAASGAVVALASCLGIDPAPPRPAALDHTAHTAGRTSAEQSAPPPGHQHAAAGATGGGFAGFDPMGYLKKFESGRVSTLPDGRTLREFDLEIANCEVEVARGVTIQAWSFNGQIPGPTLRATAGDRVRVLFHNGGDHMHSVHFHGIHPAEVDGGFESVAPGGDQVYEFDADPFGMHLYHCHTGPLAKHLAKGLYGAFVVDPVGGRPPVDREMVMLQNGWDVDGDGVNDFYAVNGPAFAYNDQPIRLRVGERVRIYLGNVLEFDPVNSFHLHANFFDYFPTGTRLEPSELTDTVIQGQGQRGILELSYRYPGRYMFHAHKTEFAELGWMGVFEVAA